MSLAEKTKWSVLTGVRSSLAILDLVGLVGVGLIVSSSAAFLQSGSDASRMIVIGGLTLPAANAASLPALTIGIVALFVFKAILSLALTRSVALLVAAVEARASKVIAQNIFGSDLGRSKIRNSEEVIFSIQVGSPAAFNSLLNSASTIISETALFVLVGFGFVLVNPAASVFALTYFVLVAILIQASLGLLMEKASEQVSTSTIASNRAVGDLTRVFRELHVLGHRGKFIERIYSARMSAAGSLAKQTYLSGMPRYIVETALLLGVSTFTVFQALTGDLIASATTLGIFLAGGFRLTAAMLPLQSAFLSIRGLIPIARSAHFMLSLPSAENQAKSLEKKDSPGRGPYGVKLKGTSFTYPDSRERAISNVNLVIQPGQQVALIGPSGSGKSTLADLMCGVLTCSEGALHFTDPDGVRIADPGQLSIGYVPQQPGMVSGTIAQNVALGVLDEAIDRNSVESALESVGLLSFIRSLPKGIDSDLGTQRDSLSGGQLQRVGIARALYGNPGLLVLDEATSALDADSERAIQDTLSQIRAKTSVLIIAHRLNTVQHSDNVYLLLDGRVADKGTFTDLISRNESVRRLVSLMKVG